MRTVASFSSALFFVNAAERVNTKTDEFVIGGFLPVARIAPYSVARRLSELPQILTLQFINVLLPLASELDAEGDRQRLRALYVAATRLALVAYIRTRSRSHGSCETGSRRLGGTRLCRGATSGRPCRGGRRRCSDGRAASSSRAWRGIGCLRSSPWPRPLNLALSVVLVGPFGVMGVALAHFALSLQSAFFLAYSTQVNGVGVRARSRGVPARTAPVGPMVAVLFGLRALVDPASWLTVVPVGGAGAAAYVATYLWVGASAGERQIANRLALATLHLGPLGASDPGVARIGNPPRTGDVTGSSGGDRLRVLVGAPRSRGLFARSSVSDCTASRTVAEFLLGRRTFKTERPRPSAILTGPAAGCPPKWVATPPSPSARHVSSVTPAAKGLQPPSPTAFPATFAEPPIRTVALGIAATHNHKSWPLCSESA